MWTLVLVFNLCMVSEVGCDPQVQYVAKFETEAACRAHLGDDKPALQCLPPALSRIYFSH